MSDATFEFDATFGDDYLHFYLPVLDEARSEAETQEIMETLRLTAGDRVLDAPCGHGRIANRLASRGIEMCGLDRSPAFVDLGRHGAAQLGVDVDYRVGDITNLPGDLDGSFDAAINWFTSFGYHDDVTNHMILAGYHRVLRPGGQLLIETLHRDWIVRNHTPAPFAAVTRVGEDLMLDQNTFDPLTGCINAIRTVIRDGVVRRSRHFVRLPSATELGQWLDDAGFVDVEITGRSATPLTLDSHRLMVIAHA